MQRGRPHAKRRGEGYKGRVGTHPRLQRGVGNEYSASDATCVQLNRRDVIVNGFTTKRTVPTPAELSGNFPATGFPAYDSIKGSPCQQALVAVPATPCMPVSTPLRTDSPESAEDVHAEHVDTALEIHQPLTPWC